MLQLSEWMGKQNKKTLYCSGEESTEQIRLRSKRLKVTSENIYLLCTNNAEHIIEAIEENKPDLVIVDSIQSVSIPSLDALPGTVTQLRETTSRLLRTVKNLGIPLFLVGHVTKEGLVAGPKIIEHMVDTVLYFEGEQRSQYKILRAVKNRFGSTNEIGIFEMKGTGLAEVKNTSGIFLEERLKGAEGTCVTATIEGSRSFLIEVQALVSKTNLAFPRRTASGFSFNRLQMLIAAISNKAGLRLDSQDVYVNIVGGIKTTEPAVDLAVCLSIVSALQKRPIDAETIVLGEVGLTGEVRTVPQIEKRIAEAEKLGFKRIILPRSEVKTSLQVIRVNSLRDAITKILF